MKFRAQHLGQWVIHVAPARGRGLKLAVLVIMPMER